MLDYFLFWIIMNMLFLCFTHKQLLQNGDHMGIIKGLGSHRINSCGYIDFSCGIQSGKIESQLWLSSTLNQIVYIWLVEDLGQHLQIRINLLNLFVNEDCLSVYHLFI